MSGIILFIYLIVILKLISIYIYIYMLYAEVNTNYIKNIFVVVSKINLAFFFNIVIDV